MSHGRTCRAAEDVDGPAGLAPEAGVQAAARVDDHRAGHCPGQRGGVDDPVPGPLGEGHGEPRPPGIEVLSQQQFQAGSEERRLALGGLGDLLHVDVDRQPFVPEVSQADGVGEPEVSGPDDGDPRRLASSWWMLTVDSQSPGTLDADAVVTNTLPPHETAITLALAG
jgi:hypothetical protein